VEKFSYDVVSQQISSTPEGEVFTYVNILMYNVNL